VALPSAEIVGSKDETPVRIAVISDIHGNWHALEAVLADLDHESVDEAWCLGDIVGYGPQPNRCVEGVRGRAALCLIGNHDLAALGKIGIDDFSHDAAASARWTADELDDDARAFLESLEPKGERPGVELFHASPRDPVSEYILSESVVRDALDRTTAELVLVGHTHIPVALLFSDSGSLAGGLARGGSEIELAGGRFLLNPGSVGQPRDGDPRAAYLLLDFDARTAHYRRVPYDIEATQAEIRESGLPEALAERLAEGE
jgi:diadenosine tetraphosphatase ApaH/serine/threonine PP2A family protein phosphatase